MDSDKELLSRAAKAADDINSEFNACMFRDHCRAMQSRIAELEAALKPFAALASGYEWSDDTMRVAQITIVGKMRFITVYDLRQAAAALGENDA